MKARKPARKTRAMLEAEVKTLTDALSQAHIQISHLRAEAFRQSVVAQPTYFPPMFGTVYQSPTPGVW